MNKLSSRAIIGEFYKRLNADDGMEWINAISNYFTSDQDTEEYVWLGQSPVMREWVGGRHSKGFTSNVGHYISWTMNPFSQLCQCLIIPDPINRFVSNFHCMCSAHQVANWNTTSICMKKWGQIQDQD